MHYLRNMLSDAMAADCDSLHENVIVPWRHCKKKSKQTFEQVNITDTPKNMKLNCIPIAQVNFWNRVRPTFIYFIHYFFSYFSPQFEIRPFDCVYLVLVFVCLSLTSCVVWPVRNKNKKLRTDFILSAIHHAVVTGLKERKKNAFTLYNNVYEQLSIVWSNVETIRATVWKVFEYLHSYFFFSSHLRCSAGLVGCGWCVNCYRGYLISFQLDRH